MQTFLEFETKPFYRAECEKLRKKTLIKGTSQKSGLCNDQIQKLFQTCTGINKGFLLWVYDTKVDFGFENYII